MKIMNNKNKLKGTNIFINDDCTKRERIMQKEIRRMALEAKKEHKIVTMKYKKVIIDVEEWVWNDKEMKLFRNQVREKTNRCEGSEGRNENINLLAWNIAGLRNNDKEAWNYNRF